MKLKKHDAFKTLKDLDYRKLGGPFITMGTILIITKVDRKGAKPTGKVLADTGSHGQRAFTARFFASQVVEKLAA